MRHATPVEIIQEVYAWEKEFYISCIFPTNKDISQNKKEKEKKLVIDENRTRYWGWSPWVLLAMDSSQIIDNFHSSSPEYRMSITL